MEKEVASTPPIVTNRPFEARATTSPENELDDESDFESQDDSPILTPTSSRFIDDADDDLPPSYDEVQAQRGNEYARSRDSFRASDLEIRRVIIDENPRPSYPLPSSSQNPAPAPVRRSPTSQSQDDRANAMLERLLTFTRNAPDNDASYASRLPRRIAIPPTYDANTAGFARAYCKALHTRSISAGEFAAFIDGIGSLLASGPYANEAQQALLYVADPSGTNGPRAAKVLQQYMERANVAFFAPRGLKAYIQTLPQLISRLPVPRGRRERRAMRQLHRAVWGAETAEAASKALDPYVEPLCWNVFSSPANRVLNGLAAGDDGAEASREATRPSRQETAISDGILREAAPIAEQETGVFRNRDSLFSNWSLPSYHTTMPPVPPQAPGPAVSNTEAAAPHIDGAAPRAPDPTAPVFVPGVRNPAAVPPPNRSNSWQEWGEKIGQRAEKWGMGIGQRAEWLGEELSRRAEKWSDNFGRDMERNSRELEGIIGRQREYSERQRIHGHGREGRAEDRGEEPNWGIGRRNDPFCMMSGHDHRHGHHAHYGGPFAAQGPFGAGPPVPYAFPFAPHGSPFGRRGGRGGFGETYGGPPGQPSGRHRRDSISSTSSSSSSSSSESDSGNSTAVEAEDERFDAEAAFHERIAAIENKAVQDKADLGGEAKVEDVQKIERTKQKEIVKAEADKCKAEEKYAAKMFKMDMKHAYKSQKRSIKRERRDWKRNLHYRGSAVRGERCSRREVRDIKEDFRRRKRESRDAYRDAVREYRNALRNDRHGRIGDTGEQRTNRHGSCRRRSTRNGGRMVWLVLEDLEGGRRQAV